MRMQQSSLNPLKPSGYLESDDESGRSQLDADVYVRVIEEMTVWRTGIELEDNSLSPPNGGWAVLQLTKCSETILKTSTFGGFVPLFNFKL